MPEPSIEEIEAKAAQGGIRKAAWAERYPDSLSDQRGAISESARSNPGKQEELPKEQGGGKMTEETKFATKEEVQREHKDLRTFVLSKGSFLIGCLALLLAIALFWVSQGVNSKIDSAEKSIKAEITSVGTTINANEKVAAIRFDAQQKQMDGIQQQLASMNDALINIQKNSHK